MAESSLEPLVHQWSLAQDSLFEYTPLSVGQIRLLQLNPANEVDDLLHGELLVKSLDELPPRAKPGHDGKDEPIDPKKHVCFEAISYVWGDATLTDSFFTPQGYIPITASLGSILRRLRDTSKSQLYWADGICINQADMTEKGIQVSLMGVIYSSAIRVMCDICEETEDISLILDAMDRYWKRSIRHGYAMGQGEGMVLSGESTAKLMEVQLPTDEEADAIDEVEGEEWPRRYLKLVSAPWFHRLWVVQEFVLGRDVTMVFGRRHVPWGQLWAGTIWYSGVVWPWDSADFTTEQLTSLFMSYNAMCLVRSCRTVDINTPHGREFNKIVNLLLCGVEMNQANLSMCLVFFCSHGCTVPRDRYFGILGMVDEEDRKNAVGLKPDYSSPIKEITMNFWKYAIQYASGGELILFAGLPGRVEDYPSWLRDITASSPMSHIWIGAPISTAWHKAGGVASTWSARFRDDNPECLFVQGYHVDDISERSSLEPLERLGLDGLGLWLNEAFVFFTSGLKTLDCDTDMRYALTGEHIHEAALKAACDFNLQDATPAGIKAFEPILRMGLSIPLAATSDSIEGEGMEAKILTAFKDEAEVLEALFLRVHTSRGLRFCRTKKGLITMLHKQVCVGDSIWILKGCRLPVVLRPILSHPGSFEFVGGGYVYGLMNGEALHRPGFKWKSVSLR
ncbi:heterokaryon incompatibility protein-domain-containing protein [Fusarium tricinctum]|uniref:Heterokaryon incompatibility protein-domain-containing protein n=1 Tax=Fusarium tricinctum TaxID=61284 RepID=A0A8K0WI22_9HYPO|nr:heterokaryon incompatibility protein-domain-containing protein [Fusarium tricinctum]